MRSWHTPYWDPLRKCECVIYALVDPRDGEVRYVGRTIMPRDRMRSHLRDGKGKKGPWVHELRAAGMEPTFRELERGEWTWYQAVERELHWSQRFPNLLSRESGFSPLRHGLWRRIVER